MSEGTKIQWADDTHNFWRGCTKISPGCAHCYAEVNVGVKMAGIEWGKGKARKRKRDVAADPIRWNKKPWVCNCCGESFTAAAGLEHRHGTVIPTGHRRRVFSLSLGDIWDEEVPIEYLADSLRVIHECPNLDFLLLSKRPGNWERRIRQCFDVLSLEPRWLVAWTMGTPPSNVWVGASVEDQQRADERIPELLKIPAAVHFLSVEPMLGPITFQPQHLDKGRYGTLAGGTVDWVIFGGESGPRARPCNVEWIRDGVRQCKAAGVPAFVKQLGSRPYSEKDRISFGDAENRTLMPGLAEVCFVRHFNDKKGGLESEWPKDLHGLRQFPDAIHR